jgi:hypothetical protein
MMVGVPVTVCAYAGTPRRAGPIGELVPTAPRWWHATVAFGIHRRVPVFLKVRDPRLQGLRVVLPK